MTRATAHVLPIPALPGHPQDGAEGANALLQSNPSVPPRSEEQDGAEGATGPVQPISSLPPRSADQDGGRVHTATHAGDAAVLPDTFRVWEGHGPSATQTRSALPIQETGARGHGTGDTHAPFAAPSGEDPSDGGHSAFVPQVGDAASDTDIAVDGQDTDETREPFAVEPLTVLHDRLGHYARQYLDLQKTRIALGNREAALIRERGEDDALVLRMTARDLSRDDYLGGVKDSERKLSQQLEWHVRQHFMADWVKATRGLGPLGFGLLIGVTGSLDRFATVSKLWKYVGMSVEPDGRAPRRKKGEKAHYSPQGRVLCHQLGEAIVKVGAGGPYRAAYDTKKAEYLLRDRAGPSKCPFGQTHTDRGGKVLACGDAHAHNAAMRYAVKRLLRDLWLEWHRRSGHTFSEAHGCAAAAPRPSGALREASGQHRREPHASAAAALGTEAAG